MKLALVVFAFVAAVSAAPTRSLDDDIRDIIASIPVDEIREIFRRYAETDPEVQEVVAYLQGEEWAELVAAVANHPTWISFKEYMLEEGIDVDYYVQLINTLISSITGIPTKAASRSIRDMIDEIRAIFPLEDFLLVINEKLRTSEEFQEFFAKISSEQAYALVEEIRALEEVQRIAQVLRDRGVNVDEGIEAIYTVLGWN